jgi:membrane peptidoglycan carboxypeptidase
LRKINLYFLLKNRRKNQAQDSHGSTVLIRSTVIGALSVLLILVLGALLFAGVTYAGVASKLPSLDELPALLNPENGELLQPSVITDRTGQTILYTLDNPGIQRRYLVVDPEQEDHFNPQLIRAVVAKLDPSLWQNPGYSLKNWQDPAPATIAERLVSDLLLWKEPLSTTRAIRMRLLAAQVVSRFGRTQVLEWYLNSVYFGHKAFGAEAGAQLYFMKSAQDLTLAESAMLAVLIDSPALNPLDAPTAALELQHQFLAEMTEKMIISTQEFSSAIRQELSLRQKISEPDSLAPAFTKHLIQSLAADFAQNRLERGGLVIQSSLDLELQNQFECTLRVQLNRIQGINDPQNEETCKTALLLPTQIFNWSDYSGTAGAGIVLDPHSGEILAYVDPVTYDGTRKPDSGYQPGSLLSPFVALAGFARGLSPSSLQWDVPTTQTGLAETVQNPDGLWHGPTTLRASIANDYLIPVANVANQIGAVNAWHLASALGLSSMENTADSSAALFSGSPSSMLEIAEAYGTLANSGTRSGKLDGSSGEIKPSQVVTVRSTTGRLVMDKRDPDTSPVLSQPLSYLINQVLSDESARWPSLGYPNSLEIGQTTAAKMGVTASKNQVWTVGYTPDRLVLVWMGNTAENQNSPQVDPRITAGIWYAVMKQALTGLPATDWSTPEGITRVKVCVPSGALPTVDCPNIMEEVFLSGNEPTRLDSLFEKIKVNRETGQRATVFTNPTLIDEQLFINVPAAARDWAISAGLSVAPSGYDAIPDTLPDPEVNISSPGMFAPVSGKVTISGIATGANFASYTIQTGEGIDPSDWLQINTSKIAVPSIGSLAVWDTTGLDGLYAIRLTVVGADQSVRSSTIQVTVDNTPPSVKITYPAANQEVKPINGQVNLQAEIEDSTDLQKVEWWLDGKLVSTQTDGPYLYLLSAGSGKHTLQVTAQDKAGNQTSTNKMEFTITN